MGYFSIQTSEPFVVHKAEGEHLCAFPAAAAFRILDKDGSSRTRLFVYFSQTKDDANIPPSVGLRMSDDGGDTWPYYQSHTWFPISLVQQPEGRIGGPSFVATMLGGDISSEQTIRWVHSADGGATWEVTEGKLVTPVPMRCIVAGTGRGGFAFTWVLKMEDGTLGAVLYGYYASDTKYRTIWAKSDDGGVHWSVESTVAYDPEAGPEGYCEPTVARVADGSLLCVMRIGSNKPLYQSRSHDDGRTWSEPEPLPGPTPEETYSVLPALRSLGDGRLVLSYGRPDTRMLLSEDGSGRSWTSFATTYGGTTTGYTGLTVTGENRLFLTGDTGANWQYDFKSGFPSPNPFAIWGKQVEIAESLKS
ncbi:sialidase family protein [Paenibacillus ginsengarvi]|uniref:Exo-alpha-sialidase n=1 Tax=Paenibacillus ginsengarvi TaxID=400777 RepID=A0A3B0CCL2_9BACL|nr:sialidase family protein [Paenibacillus ginsengarvi]RKN83753.1 exo-alpha-sialidase [Paenibacillus ginsengarvi]